MTAPGDACGGGEPLRPRMTMRVYRVSRDGAVTRELGRVSVMADERLGPMMSGQFPPCRCPLHSAGDRDRDDGRDRPARAGG